MSSRPMVSSTARTWVLGLGLLLWPVASRADALQDDKITIAKDLEAWDTEAAGRVLERRLAEYPLDPDLRFLKSRRAFLRGRYDEAIASLQPLAESQTAERQVQALLELYRSTAGVVKDFKTAPSSGGHFLIAYQPGVDEVLVPYADDALERAYARLGEIFRYYPTEPVRVEIYARVENLADVSPLKASEIRTSGTIALCKYNRLMIVSPRALVYGYSWLDTLAHEYAHLLITKRSRNRVPIWLHEGMAKFFENRWRETSNATLDPHSEDLLARAVRKKKLIRFEAMSPSMAKLPSQEDTGLAFAEVFMVLELLYEKGGVEGVNQLLDRMRDGLSDREAVEAVVQKSFERFQREWRNYLYQRNLKTLPTYASNRLLFRDKAKPTDELEGISDQARDLTYLGDRLAVKRRYVAAAREYRKALALLEGPQPLVSAKLAGALLKQGHNLEVPDVVTPALELNPGQVLLYLYRGKARLALGRYETAHRDLVEAVRINPFDPEVHGLLADALDKLGRAPEAEEERRRHRLVSSR